MKHDDFHQAAECLASKSLKIGGELRTNEICMRICERGCRRRRLARDDSNRLLFLYSLALS